MIESLRTAFAASTLTAALAIFGAWLTNEIFKVWLLWRTAASPQPTRAPASLSSVYAKVWGWLTPLLNLVFFVRWLRRGLKQSRRAIVSFEPLNAIDGAPTRLAFLIHGTWRLANYRVQWATVIESLLKEEPNTLLVGFHWPAFNSIGSRLQSGRILVKIARRWSRNFRHQVPIVFVGHSHGASVAFEALRSPHCPSTCTAVCLGMPPLTAEPAPDAEFKGRAWSHPELGMPTLWSGLLMGAALLIAAFEATARLIPEVQGNLIAALALLLVLVRMVSSRRRARHELAKYYHLRRLRHAHEVQYARRLAGSDTAYLGFHLWFVPRNIARLRAMRAAQLLQVSKDETTVFIDAQIKVRDFFSRRVLSFMRLMVGDN